MAVNFLSSCAVNLSGHSIGAPAQKRFCSYNGFMTQFFVVQSTSRSSMALFPYTNSAIADYWVLLIACCTFFILANYKRISSWIQEHRLILWFLPWGVSALWAGLGLGLDGYSDIGACTSLISIYFSQEQKNPTNAYQGAGSAATKSAS